MVQNVRICDICIKNKITKEPKRKETKSNNRIENG